MVFLLDYKSLLSEKAMKETLLTDVILGPILQSLVRRFILQTSCNRQERRRTIPCVKKVWPRAISALRSEKVTVENLQIFSLAPLAIVYDGVSTFWVAFESILTMCFFCTVYDASSERDRINTRCCNEINYRQLLPYRILRFLVSRKSPQKSKLNEDKEFGSVVRNLWLITTSGIYCS